LTDNKSEISIIKHMFYNCFKSAFKKAFCIKNIESI